jgi:hypothetical protein
MGYAIVGGIGLLVGIGFLVWALAERSKRAAAERTAAEAGAAATDLRQALAANKVSLCAVCDALRASEAAAAALRLVLDQLRIQLRLSRDIKTVVAWLDNELKETDL